jgi:flagellar motor switch protein FliG
MNPQSLPGPLKVAILIQSLGKDVSDQLLLKFDSKEREIIQTQITQLDDVSPELTESVAKEFASRGLVAASSPEKLPVPRAATKQEGSALESDYQSAELRALQSLDAQNVLELIGDEHPQTIAMILVHLKTDVAGDVLARLSDEVKADVAMRIASLDKVKSDMVGMLDRVFEDLLKTKESSATHETGGVRCLAEILNQMSEGSGEGILSEIEESDPELAAQIKQRMFVFEDLTKVDDQGLQKVLRGVETRELAMALKAASQEVKDKIFKNMSERAAEILKEEMETLGPVRMKEVEDAQQIVTKIVQAKEAKGELIVSGRKGDDLIE